MRFFILCLAAVLCLLLANQMKCGACDKGPFSNISSHRTRCQKYQKLIAGGYDRRIADANRRRAEEREVEEERARQAKEQQEAIERAEAERQARIQASICPNIRRKKVSNASDRKKLYETRR